MLVLAALLIFAGIGALWWCLLPALKSECVSTTTVNAAQTYGEKLVAEYLAKPVSDYICTVDFLVAAENTPAEEWCESLQTRRTRLEYEVRVKLEGVGTAMDYGRRRHASTNLGEAMCIQQGGHYYSDSNRCVSCGKETDAYTSSSYS